MTAQMGSTAVSPWLPLPAEAMAGSLTPAMRASAAAEASILAATTMSFLIMPCRVRRSKALPMPRPGPCFMPWSANFRLTSTLCSRNSMSSWSNSSKKSRSLLRGCSLSQSSISLRRLLEPLLESASKGCSKISSPFKARSTRLSCRSRITASATSGPLWSSTFMYSPVSSSRLTLTLPPAKSRLAPATATSSMGASTSMLKAGSPATAPRATAMSKPLRPPVPGMETAMPFLYMLGSTQISRESSSPAGSREAAAAAHRAMATGSVQPRAGATSILRISLTGNTIMFTNAWA